MQPQQQTPVQPNYDFITNPEKFKPRRVAGNSMMSRILLVGVGLILLLVGFGFIKGLVTGGGNADAMLHVVQNQKAVLHLVTDAGQVPAISTPNRNFAVTAKLVVGSDEGQLISYLTKQKQKLPANKLNLKISNTVDKQLANALVSSTYDVTFQSVMKSQLTTYQTALNVAYQKTKGPVGRKLLKAQYDSAGLLLQQLVTPAS
jgi:hypothetical protein